MKTNTFSRFSPLMRDFLFLTLYDARVETHGKDYAFQSLDEGFFISNMSLSFDKRKGT